MEFEGNLAAVTGGGDGMGRELCLSLASQGCSVALCDLNLEAAEETRRLAEQLAPAGVGVKLSTVGVSLSWCVVSEMAMLTTRVGASDSRIV